MQYIDKWNIQMRKGYLEMFVLTALQKEPMYGYELVRVLGEIPEAGGPDGTIYPLLARLRKQGLVASRLAASEEGPARRYYSLTSRGSKVVAEMKKRFEQLAAGYRTACSLSELSGQPAAAGKE
jgi:PadR family transcriptional regulator PadR